MAGRDHDASSAEDHLIARFFRPLAKHPGAFNLTDDAAALTLPAGAQVVITTDAIVGGVHFFPNDPAETVARKALRVNLSDLAAKGARPAGFLLTLALPKTIGEDWLKSFAAALGRDCDENACPLLGGDSVRTPGPLTISITAFGTLPKGTMVRRGDAKPGDRVLVTGTIGDAALGLTLRRKAAPKRWKLTARERRHLTKRYLEPEPRNALAEAVRRHASAAMDVSDGLVGDLGKLCAASRTTAVIEVDRVPLSEAARRVVAAEPARIETVLTGGDDYEVLCTVAPNRIARFRAASVKAGVPVTEIGRVVEGRAPPTFLCGDGRPMHFKQTSFSHF